MMMNDSEKAVLEQRAEQDSGQKSESWPEFIRQMVMLFLGVFLLRSLLFEPFNIPSASMIPTLQIGDFVGVSKFSYGYSRYSFPLSPEWFSGRIFGSLPHRGDVAVFRYTQNTSVDYIKRIVGLPGDHIRMTEGRLYINDHEVPSVSLGHYEVHDESGRLLAGVRYRETMPREDGRTEVRHEILKLTDDGQANNTPDYVVPDGCLFAMGDDRDDSSDSRFQGGRDVGQCAISASNDFLQMGSKDLGFVPVENLVGRADVVLFSIDMHHPAWQFWYWPFEIRWNRILRGIS